MLAMDPFCLVNAYWQSWLTPGQHYPKRKSIKKDLWVNTQGFPPMSQPFPTQGIPRSGHGTGGGTAPSVALGLSDGTLHFGALEPGEVQWEGAANCRDKNDQSHIRLMMITDRLIYCELL